MTQERRIIAVKQNPKTVTITLAKHPGERHVDLSTLARLVSFCEEARVLLALTQGNTTGPLGARIVAYLQETC